MANKHKFCGLHRIAYNRDFDALCPQCLLGRITGAKQYDFDTDQQKPVDSQGKPLKDEALLP